jgi:hypothetical protein
MNLVCVVKHYFLVAPTLAIRSHFGTKHFSTALSLAVSILAYDSNTRTKLMIAVLAAGSVKVLYDSDANGEQTAAWKSKLKLEETRAKANRAKAKANRAKAKAKRAEASAKAKAKRAKASEKRRRELEAKRIREGRSPSVLDSPGSLTEDSSDRSLSERSEGALWDGGFR